MVARPCSPFLFFNSTVSNEDILVFDLFLANGACRSKNSVNSLLNTCNESEMECEMYTGDQSAFLKDSDRYVIFCKLQVLYEFSSLEKF